MSRPLSLPRLTSSETQALASLATQGAGHLVALPHAQNAHLHLTPLPPGQAPVQAGGTCRLHMEWAGGQMALDMAPAQLDAWVQMALGVDELVQLPPAFRQAALEHVVQWVSSGLDKVGRGQAHVRHMAPVTEPRPADAPHALALELVLANGQVLPGLLHLDSLALMLVGSLVQSAQPEQEDHSMDDLPIALDLCVGHTTLPLAQLQQLQVGGMVRVTHPHLPPDRQGVLLTTAIGQRRLWSAPAQWQEATLILTANPTTMNTATDAQHESGDSAIALDNLPVHLSFDVGQKVLTLAQLRQLSEGQALSLDRQIQSAVNIRANGALIGQGQLVDIDGQLGVLINQLHTPQHRTAE